MEEDLYELIHNHDYIELLNWVEKIREVHDNLSDEVTDKLGDFAISIYSSYSSIDAFYLKKIEKKIYLKAKLDDVNIKRTKSMNVFFDFIDEVYFITHSGGAMNLCFEGPNFVNAVNVVHNLKRKNVTEQNILEINETLYQLTELEYECEIKKIDPGMWGYPSYIKKGKVLRLFDLIKSCAMIKKNNNRIILFSKQYEITLREYRSISTPYPSEQLKDKAKDLCQSLSALCPPLE